MPMQLTVAAPRRMNARLVEPELELADVPGPSKASMALDPSSAMRRRTSSGSPWWPMGTRPRSSAVMRRNVMDSSVMGVGAARRERRARESAERYYTPGSDSGQREAAARGPAGENVNHRA